MPLNITFLGHSGFLFDDGTTRVCVDPFLTGNTLAQHQPGDIHTHYLALTHGHGDHCNDDGVTIARNNDATVIAPFEVANWFGEQGIEKREPGNPGGRVYTDFGHVAFTPALHSSSGPDGRYMGVACGLVFEFERVGVSVYHAGDTALFSDMKLIGQLAKPDIAILPVGDRFTMTPHLGKLAAEMIRPKLAIPCHYKTFPLLTSDISAFTPDGVQVRELAPGESFEYAG